MATSKRPSRAGFGARAAGASAGATAVERAATMKPQTVAAPGDGPPAAPPAGDAPARAQPAGVAASAAEAAGNDGKRNGQRHGKGNDATPATGAPEENAGAGALLHEPGQRRHDPEAIRRAFETGEYPLRTRTLRSAYERRKAQLQVELLKVPKWCKDSGERVVLLFEDRDAAGSGGTIKRYTEHLDPRGARVTALEKPTDEERGQWYFQRYVQHLPTAGEIVLFDRSWCDRAGVERVMGFCSPNDYLEFMRQAPELGRMLVRSGVKLFKYWFSITREQQRGRVDSRQRDPPEQWKLSPIDVASLTRRDDYTEVKEAMFFHADTADAPWTIVKSDDKKRARRNCMQHFLSELPCDGEDHAVVRGPDPLLGGSGSHVVHASEHILGKSVHPDTRPRPLADTGPQNA